MFNVAPEFMVNGTEVLRTFAPFKVIAPVFAIITPPVAANGVIHSAPAVRGVAVLYLSVAAVPYIGAAETVAVPSIERIPLTLTPVVVFAPLPESVKLL